MLSSGFISIFSYLWAKLFMWATAAYWTKEYSGPSDYKEILQMAYNYCVHAPVMEELIFRLIPFLFCSIGLFVVRVNAEIDKIDPDLVKEELVVRLFLFGFCFSVILFGISHGSIWNIFLQGAFGLVLWFQFLYCSRIGKDLMRGLLAATLSHSLYNLICLISVIKHMKP